MKKFYVGALLAAPARERRENQMWHRVSAFTQKMNPAIPGFLHRFKNDERGLSGVVVAILLILVAVLAIVMIWGFLSGWLAELWDQITGQVDGIA